MQVVAEKAAEDAASDSVDPEQPPVDWLITMLLFFFPAVGGLLFGALFPPLLIALAYTAYFAASAPHPLRCWMCQVWSLTDAQRPPVLPSSSGADSSEGVPVWCRI